MTVYIGMYLAGIIYHLNFAILIVNEIYGRNRSIREPGGSKKISSNTGDPGKYGRVGHPIPHMSLLRSCYTNLSGTGKCPCGRPRSRWEGNRLTWTICRVNTVSKVNGHGLIVQVSIPGRSTNFSLFHNIQMSPGIYPAFTSMESGVSRPQREAHHPPPRC
jgi:hypothetical protein